MLNCSFERSLDKVIINSSVALNPRFMLKRIDWFGSHRIVAIDWL
ncbi:MAG: hypothetical protein ACTS6P_01675 [Candidatus Hodgkinia cicadicola]